MTLWLGVGIASENRIAIYCDFWVCIEIRITIYRTPKQHVCLWEGNFLRADFIQHQGEIKCHSSIDRSQTQHEHLQLLLIHLNPSNSLSYEKSLNKERI